MRKQILFLIIILFFTGNFFAQEVLLSEEEQYYNFLALNEVIERPYMNYRTLSDSSWNTETVNESDNVWSNNILSTEYFFLNNQIKLKIFDPEWFNSYNSAAPYGQNDGSLWQGKGYNTKITGGARVEAYGFELTFKPEFNFSQNKPFEYPASSYYGDLYFGKAQDYGDYSLGYVDAPQRFGDEPFFIFNLGDSEIRYTWKTITAGFGTQNIWLGPAILNPIMHSNNAAEYPKIDIGIRKQSLDIKDIWLGNFEFRYWAGKLSESDYFDNIETNDNNLIAGISVSYEVPFLPGLILGFNRTMLSKWDNICPYTLFDIIIPAMKHEQGQDVSDGRASVTAEYFIPKGGIDLYLEWGRNDFNCNLDNLLRYPFHTQALTAGFKKNINYKQKENLHGQFIFELSYLGSSMDYHFFYDWGGIGNDFYTHGLITQGYTNKGQYLGAGIGAGGNTQYVGYKLIYPKGYTSFFVQRTNPDLNYFYFIADRGNYSINPNEYTKACISVNIDFGITSLYYITENLRATLSFILNEQHNPLNVNQNIDKDTLHPGTAPSTHRHNFVTQFAIKYYF